MDDRSVLFASRQTGMSTDDIEVALKEMKNLPQTQRHSRIAGQSDQQLKREAERRGQQGMAGLKKKFEQAREHVQNKLQQVGADMLTDISNSIESQLNDMSGTIAEEASKNIDEVYEAASRGDKSGLKSTFGIGREMRPEAQRMLGMSGGPMSSGAGGQGVLANFTTGGGLFGGVSDFDRMKTAGYGSAFGENGAGPKSDLDVTSGMERIHRIQMAALGPGDPQGASYGEKLAGTMRELYQQNETTATSGLDRINAFGKNLRQAAETGNPDAQKALKEFNSKSEGEKAAFANSFEGKMGLPGGSNLADRMASPNLGVTGQGFATAGDRAKALGAMATGQGGAEQTFFGSVGKGIASGAAAGFGAGLLFAGVGALPGAIIGGIAGGIRGAMNAGDANRAGQFMLDEKQQKTSRDILGGTPEQQEAAKAALQNDILKLQTDPKVNEAQLSMLKKMQGVSRVADFMKINPNATKEEVHAEMKRLGHDPKDLGDMLKVMHESGIGQQEINVRAEAARRGAMGRVEEGELKSARAGDLQFSDKLSDKAKGALGSRFAAVAAEAKMGLSGDTATEAGLIDEATGKRAQERQAVWSMSTQERRAAAKEFRAGGASGIAKEYDEVSAIQDRAERLVVRQGGAGIAKLFGVGVTPKEGRKFRNMDAGELGKTISERMGLDAKEIAGDKAAALEELKLVGARQGKGGVGSPEYKAAMEKVLKTGRLSEAATEVGEITKLLASKDPTKVKEGTERQDRFMQSAAGVEAQKKQQEKQDMKNPVVKGLADLGKSISTALEGNAAKIVAGFKEAQGADKE
jgi:hypothetical protein